MTGSEQREPEFDLGREFDRGLNRMAAALGEQVAANVRRARDRAAQAGDATRVELPVATAWGWLPGRAGLTERERVIAMLAVDVARGTRQALIEHLSVARSIGVSAAEISELLVQLGPYAGYPAINDAARIVRESSTGAAPAISETADDGARPGWLGATAELVELHLVVADARATARALSWLLGVAEWTVVRLDGAGPAPGHNLLSAVGTTPGGLRLRLLEPHHGAPALQRQLLAAGSGVAALVVAERQDTELGQIIANSGARPAWDWVFPGGERLIALETSGELGYRIALASPSIAAFDAAATPIERWTMTDGADSPVVQPALLAHLGIVLPDIRTAMQAHAAAYGRARWPVLDFSCARGSLTDARYNGEPGTESYLSSIARVGSFAVELIQPLSGPSRYLDGYLRPRGTGVHHLFFGPLATHADWDRAVRRLAERDFRLVTEAKAWNGTLCYAYADTLGPLGFDIELVTAMDGLPVRPSDFAIFEYDHSAPTGAQSRR